MSRARRLSCMYRPEVCAKLAEGTYHSPIQAMNPDGNGNIVEPNLPGLRYATFC